MSEPAPSRLFLSPPHMTGREAELVAEAFRSNYIAPVGPQIAAFEQEMEAYLGRGRCVALCSGTAALHLALRIAGVGQGDTVICSDLTFAASANPILYQGATPVFVDADASWNMDPKLLESALETMTQEGRLPKVLVLTHLYGQPADLLSIDALCRKHGVILIEDAAESLGAFVYTDHSDKNRPTGTVGRFGALSFNGNKIITSGGGGMLVCRNQEDADRARFLATQARDPAPHYEHSEFGYNYRLSNVLAAIGRGQLPSLEARVARRREIFQTYARALEDMPDIAFMPEFAYGRGNRWLTCVLFARAEEGERGYALREAVRLALEAENIESRPVWKPMHLQPLYRNTRCFGGEVGADLFQRGLCLPSGTQMTESDIKRVAGIVRSIVQGYAHP